MADVVYVLTHGKFVAAVSADKEQMQAEALRVLRTENSVEHVWVVDPWVRVREELRYRPVPSARYRNSDVSVTRMVVGEVGR